jgi:hypothetical protein
MRVEELVVEVDNSRNVAVVRATIHWGSHVGKWPNRLDAVREDSSLEPPTVVLKWTAGGDLGWPRGEVEGGPCFLAVGAASWHQPCSWRHRRGKGGGSRGAGQHRGGVREMARCLCWLGLGRTRGTRGRTRGLSGPLHFGPKSEIEMGVRRRVRTVLSVWVVPLG